MILSPGRLSLALLHTNATPGCSGYPGEGAVAVAGAGVKTKDRADVGQCSPMLHVPPSFLSIAAIGAHGTFDSIFQQPAPTHPSTHQNLTHAPIKIFSAAPAMCPLQLSICSGKDQVGAGEVYRSAKENARPVDPNNTEALLQQAMLNSTEAKMKYLGVDDIQTVYKADKNSSIRVDSIVAFTKGDYIFSYDFVTAERQLEYLKSNSSLNNFEQLNNRLYMGQR